MPLHCTMDHFSIGLLCLLLRHGKYLWTEITFNKWQDDNAEYQPSPSLNPHSPASWGPSPAWPSEEDFRNAEGKKQGNTQLFIWNLERSLDRFQEQGLNNSLRGSGSGRKENQRGSQREMKPPWKGVASGPPIPLRVTTPGWGWSPE